jgi:hypothetical protein
MRRRDFITGSAALGLGLSASTAAQAAGAGSKEIIELRTYHFATPAKVDAFEAFLARAAVPAMKRAGAGLVGVFRLRKADNPDLKIEADPNDLYVLVSHPTAESFLTLMSRVMADETFRKDGADILKASPKDPAYTRFESTVMLAFDAAPKVDVPSKAPGRILQLRIYESHNSERAMKKVAMFNEGGEIDIFRRHGMNPVFFGQALAGPRLPNLHYMLSFDDKAAQEKAWGGFGGDPAWNKLKSDPLYADTVSNITNLFLRPAAASEV